MVPAGKVEEGVFRGVGHEDDIATVAAVAAIGAALGDELFTAEGDASRSAIAGFDVDGCFVDKHG
jgi:hypothetical protein